MTSSRRASHSRRLRTSGVLATGVFIVMAIADVLMLTTLDFSHQFALWKEAPSFPQAQVTLGYYLGELTIPLYVFAAWHVFLTVRPQRPRPSMLAIVAMAYAIASFAVWHAAFPFTRSIVRASRTEGAAPMSASSEAEVAFSTYARPLFLIGLGVTAAAFGWVFIRAIRGGTLYPRWAGIVLPGVFLFCAFPLQRLVPLPFALFLQAASWNFAGAITCALSTAILWNVDSGDAQEQD